MIPGGTRRPEKQERKKSDEEPLSQNLHDAAGICRKGKTIQVRKIPWDYRKKSHETSPPPRSHCKRKNQTRHTLPLTETENLKKANERSKDIPEAHRHRDRCGGGEKTPVDEGRESSCRNARRGHRHPRSPPVRIKRILHGNYPA